MTPVVTGSMVVPQHTVLVIPALKGSNNENSK
jgi:hypothetical protein